MACLMLRPRALPSGGGTAFPTWSKVEKPNQSARLSISYTLCCQRHKRRVALFLKITCCRTPKASSQENKEYGCPAISFRLCLFFVSDNTMLYDMLTALSRRLIWFLSTLLQVGNAVPPPLGRALGLSIRQAMATPKPN